MKSEIDRDTKRLILELRAQIAIWRAELSLKKFNPDQPRVPKGSPMAASGPTAHRQQWPDA